LVKNHVRNILEKLERRPTIVWLTIAAITGFLLLAAACVVVLPQLLFPPLSPTKLQKLPTKDQIQLQQAQGELQNNVRTLAFQGLGGLLLAAGAIATWRQIKISREGQITDRFTHAIDQLGCDERIMMRVGGIRALERIARNSAADRATIAYVLGAFIRTQAPWLVNSSEGPQHPTPEVEQLPRLELRAPDVQTAIWVLGMRPPDRDEKVSLYLSYVDLRYAHLIEMRLIDVELQCSNLACARMERIHLDGSDLSYADLRQAELQGAQLTKAKLCGAYLQGANMQGAQLEGADLTGAIEDDLTIWPAEFDADRRRAAGVIIEAGKPGRLRPLADDA
jgi:pentapeptide repeat protein